MKRSQPVTDENGESIRKDVPVYEGVPCALSGGGGSVPGRGDGRRTLDREMTIFTGPGILMKDMDKAVIHTRAGQVFQGVTGRTFAYAGSHGETCFKIETMA